MSVCETCWGDAYRRTWLLGGGQVEHYHQLLAERDSDGPHDHPNPTTDAEAPMTLTDFLLARIAEDETSIDTMIRLGDHGWWHPTRYIEECEAKRRIVALHQYDDLGNGEHSCSECDFGGYSAAWCGTLRALAAVYADHPDYHEEWQP